MNSLIYMIIGVAMGALVSIGIISFHNYEYKVPLLHLKPWYILSIVLSSVTAGIAYLKRRQSAPNARLWLKAFAIIVALHMVMFGIESIKAEKTVIKYVAFTGNEAVLGGIGQIIFGLAFAAMVLYFGRSKA